MFYLILPGIYIRLFWRSRKEPRYRQDLAQRMGHIDVGASGLVWIHAVSAGETIAAKGLIEGLLEAGHQILLTNMTPAGRDRAEALFGQRVTNVYAPYDVPHAIHRMLRRVQPRALIIIDTELWPNTIILARQNGIPVYLVNGRLSERSARGYKRIAKLATPMFESINQVFAQSESQAARFRALGAAKVIASGSVKFDSTLPPDFPKRVEALRPRFEGKQIILAASTHEGEEAMLLEAFLSLDNEQTILIIAPRHVHRTSVVVEQLEKTGIPYQQHSKAVEIESRTRLYLLDTMGELIYFFAICDVAFVGGSLVDIGGHNPMEPAGLGKPVLMGPYRRNISDIADQFIEAGALLTIASAEEARKVLENLLHHPQEMKRMSAAALDVMARNRGALAVVMNSILSTLEVDEST
tara:strand:+ start:2066 stop:3298 length:1233 start_codon:yes stop_codon:yes gene_type:complete